MLGHYTIFVIEFEIAVDKKSRILSNSGYIQRGGVRILEIPN